MQTFAVHQTGKREGEFKESKREERRRDPPKTRSFAVKKSICLKQPSVKESSEERYVQCV